MNILGLRITRTQVDGLLINVAERHGSRLVEPEESECKERERERE
jgi:hypothetical protein